MRLVPAEPIRPLREQLVASLRGRMGWAIPAAIVLHAVVFLAFDYFSRVLLPEPGYQVIEFEFAADPERSRSEADEDEATEAPESESVGASGDGEEVVEEESAEETEAAPPEDSEDLLITREALERQADEARQGRFRAVLKAAVCGPSVRPPDSNAPGVLINKCLDMGVLQFWPDAPLLLRGEELKRFLEQNPEYARQLEDREMARAIDPWTVQIAPATAAGPIDSTSIPDSRGQLGLGATGFEPPTPQPSWAWQERINENDIERQLRENESQE